MFGLKPKILLVQLTGPGMKHLLKKLKLKPSLNANFQKACPYKKSLKINKIFLRHNDKIIFFLFLRLI
jgi:hypothetical protein